MTATLDTPTHSRLAPSAASRWSVCTASVGFIEANADVLPPNTSKYADEGTDAHGIAAKKLEGWVRPETLSPYDDEMEVHVDSYVAFVRSKIEPGDRVYIERKVSLFYLPSQTGTIDVLIVKKSGKIVVIDLKYGVGVSVTAIENKQLSIYAESAIEELSAIEDIPDTAFVELYIYQPRDRNDPNPVREWIVTRGFLHSFCWPIKEAADEIMDSGPCSFVQGEAQCRFCPAKGICPAKAAAELEVVGDGPVDEVIASPALTDLTVATALTREQRVRILKAKKGLIAWLESVESQEMSELLAGAPPIGFKLVEGKSNRQWSDPEVAKKLLKNYLSAEEVCPPSDVISPAQAEKKLKGLETSSKFENKFALLIVKPAGKPTMVAESDPRPALEVDPTAGLINLNEADDCIG